MSVVLTGVQILNNPTCFTNPFQFEVHFDCLAPGIQESLEWKLVYISDPTDDSKDQELECVDVGPVTIGQNKFVFEGAAPDASLIDAKNMWGMTVIMLKGYYKDEEFASVGYFVNNTFTDGRELPLNEDGLHILPAVIAPEDLTRTIVNEPRVKERLIAWDSTADIYAVQGSSEDAKQMAMGDEDVLDLDALPDVGDGEGDDDEVDEEDEEGAVEREIDVPTEEQF